MNILDLKHFVTLDLDEKLVLLASTVNDNAFLMDNYIREQNELKRTGNPNKDT